jgi:hypothetical protein
MWHGIDGEAWQPPTNEVCEKHLYYLASKLSDVWNATYSEAIQYIRERQHTVVSTKTIVKDKQYRINLITEPAYAHFKYPLTLQTIVPSNWNGKARVIQSGKQRYVEPIIEKGKTYLFYNVIPDSAAIDIYQAGLFQTDFFLSLNHLPFWSTRFCSLVVL